jgi:flagellar biosynthetic protein FliR
MPVSFENWLIQWSGALARVGAVLIFTPLPGLRQTSVASRLFLTLTLSLIISPVLTLGRVSVTSRQLSDIAWNLPHEAAFGLAAGVVVGWLLEIFTLAMQLISVQAGFAYASTIDPATQADSGVLLVAAQLVTGLLFVSLGWEREVLGAFAASLERFPPGSWRLDPGICALVINWTSVTFTFALRLAFPVMAFLLLLDLALALLGRTQPQLQLISLALPVKMGASLVLLAFQTAGIPSLLTTAAERAFRSLSQLGIPP